MAAARHGRRATRYEAFLATGAPDDPDLVVDPASPVLQLYTAAFTGRPNGALLSHWAVLVQDLVMGNLQRVDSEYVYLNSGPLFHVATFMTTLATFHFGGTNVFTRRVDAEELCRLIADERCTGAFLMGPTIKQILEVNRDGRYDLSSLRTFRGSPEWNEMVTVDDSPWAQRARGVRPDRGHGDAHAERVGRRRSRDVGPADADGARAHRRSRRQRGAAGRGRRDRRPRARPS